jgi:hypothetical protein
MQAKPTLYLSCKYVRIYVRIYASGNPALKAIGRAVESRKQRFPYRANSPRLCNQVVGYTIIESIIKLETSL